MLLIYLSHVISYLIFTTRWDLFILNTQFLNKVSGLCLGVPHLGLLSPYTENKEKLMWRSFNLFKDFLIGEGSRWIPQVSKPAEHWEKVIAKSPHRWVDRYIPSWNPICLKMLMPISIFSEIYWKEEIWNSEKRFIQ